MSEQEKAFWAVWEKIKAHSDVYNHRQMFDLGYQAAEARIIKLLESEQCPPDEDLVECWCGSYIQAIALIKGENK